MDFRETLRQVFIRTGAGELGGRKPALRGSGAALVTNSASESDFFRESEKGQLGVSLKWRTEDPPWDLRRRAPSPAP